MKKNLIIFLIIAITLCSLLFFSISSSAQNVGINIETPQARLHIFKASSGYVGVYPHQDLIIESNDHTWINLLAPDNKEMGLLFGKPSHIASGGIVYDINNNMHFRTNGNVNRMFIGSNGNVGIGTTTPSAPLSFPAVVGDKITLYPGASGNVGFGVQGNLFQMFSDYSGADIAFGYGTSNNFTETMRVGGNGYVGIGRIPGSYKLEIGGTQPGIGFFSGTNFAGLIFAFDNALHIGGKNGVSGSSAANDLILQPPSTFPFFSGNVGVSTNTPTAKLQVNGNTMIGSGSPAAGYALSVNGKIICTEAKVQLNSSWPDYVFQNNYRLMPLQDLEQFVFKKQHLPNIPSATETELNGVELGDMVKRLVEKVEELTLYVIQLKKENTQLSKKIDQLQKN
jgi:hypothetical protein